MFSICLLMIGVYAASNPSVSVGGQVSYTARDVKIAVQGRVNGAKGQDSQEDFPNIVISETGQIISDKVTNSSTQYLDFTAGTGNSESDNLSQWSIGKLEFAEDNNGVRDVVIEFVFTNFSNYPVKANLTFSKTDAELETANVKRVADATSGYMTVNDQFSITITYSVIDDSKNVTEKDLLDMNVTFSKAESKNVSGQASYTTVSADASVLVQGKVNGVKGQSSAVDYPNATVSSNTVTATKVTDSSTQYLDYATGQNLSAWPMQNLLFSESSSGVKDIQIGFKLTNLSTSKVVASITFGKTEEQLSSANIQRTVSATEVELDANGGSSEITITYKVKNANLAVDATGLLDMNISFEKPALPVYSLGSSERSSGKITMGKQTSSSAAEDIQWKCFAYSTDGTTWTKCTGAIPTSAKYGYFVLDTYVSTLVQTYLASGKINRNNWTHSDLSGSVSIGDYYHSDIRKFLKDNFESTLNIDANCDIYKAICGRTITDLYSKIESGGTSLSLPTGANGEETDKFWLLSLYEVSTYFNDESSREWGGSASVSEDGYLYWTRSYNSSYGMPYDVTNGGIIRNNNPTSDEGARAAFMLRLS